MEKLIRRRRANIVITNTVPRWWQRFPICKRRLIHRDTLQNPTAIVITLIVHSLCSRNLYSKISRGVGIQNIFDVDIVLLKINFNILQTIQSSWRYQLHFPHHKDEISKDNWFLVRWSHRFYQSNNHLNFKPLLQNKQGYLKSWNDCRFYNISGRQPHRLLIKS